MFRSTMTLVGIGLPTRAAVPCIFMTLIALGACGDNHSPSTEHGTPNAGGAGAASTQAPSGGMPHAKSSTAGGTFVGVSDATGGTESAAGAAASGGITATGIETAFTGGADALLGGSSSRLTGAGGGGAGASTMGGTSWGHSNAGSVSNSGTGGIAQGGTTGAGGIMQGGAGSSVGQGGTVGTGSIVQGGTVGTGGIVQGGTAGTGVTTCSVASCLSNDMLTWMDSNLPEHTYVAVHAEHREPGQVAWTSVTQVYQPFRTLVNRGMRQVYWRKDDLAHDFYGEVFAYDEDSIWLRMETFPFVSGIDTTGTWDARADKFRLFVYGNSWDSRRYGKGRPIAPRAITQSWQISQSLDTYICRSFAELQQGTCTPYQSNFQDDAVTLEVVEPFSTVYDGEITEDANKQAWLASAEMKSFDRAVIINQSMGGGVGRERFIFGARAGVYYGIVRWDNAVKYGGSWYITDRTTGLVTQSDPAFSFAGMVTRGTYDFYPRAAGFRILSTGGKQQYCPHTTLPRGQFGTVANAASLPSNVFDLSGDNTMAVTTTALCVDMERADVLLTLPAGCPVTNQRGSFFVPTAQVATSVTNPTPAVVTEDWIVLCSADTTKHDTYLRLSSKSCDTGSEDSGSFVAYKDCTDADGKNCDKSQVNWLVLCSR